MYYFLSMDGKTSPGMELPELLDMDGVERLLPQLNCPALNAVANESRMRLAARHLRLARDEILRLREELAARDLADVERERTRAEDQRRVDLLSSFPGHGAG